MSESDLNYVNKILAVADSTRPYSTIYYLWAAIVLCGYVTMAYAPQWTNQYWIVTSALGFVLSMLLGHAADQKLGQMDSQSGITHALHFAILLVFIFAAIFTGRGEMVLLVIALGYGLGGLHLDRSLFIVSVITLTLHTLISFNYIQSNLVVGVVLALSLAFVGWSMPSAKPKSDTV